jgi:hypothetical protein
MIRQIVFTAAIFLSATFSALTASARDVPSRWTGDLANRIDDKTIQCIVERDPNLIVSWFSTLPGSPQERKLFSRLEDQFIRCFRTNKSQMVDWVPQYDYAAMRVAILQYLLKSGSVAVPEIRPAGLDRAAWYATEGSIPPESVVANDLGFCLAKSDWPAARTVVLSGRGSVAEATALRTLVPLVGGCIPSGAKLRIDRPRLREILEETVYHAVGGAPAGVTSSASRPAKHR